MRVPSPHDPFRPSNWRWERARWLREHGKYVRKGVDDEYTHLAKKFQAERDRARNDLELCRLEQKYPGIHFADTIYQREEREVRWTIEASLLARVPLQRIASRVNTSEDVVFWYEKLFFNVSPHLDCRYYIVNIVIGTAIHHGLNDREFDLLWKMFGYFGREHVLDFMITTFSETQTPPDRPDGVPAYLTDDGRLTVRRKSALAARLLPLHNNFTLQVILEHHAKMIELEKQGEGGGGTDAMMEIVDGMMRALGGPEGKGGGILYAGNKPSYMDTPGLAQYDERATELRAHEQLAAAMGKESQNIKDEVNWEFPDPPPEQTPGGKTK